MKKILITFGLVLFGLSLFAQNYNKKGFRVGTPSSYSNVITAADTSDMLLNFTDGVRIIRNASDNTITFWWGTTQLTVNNESLPSYPIYYVSNDGDDGNDGLTPATAWETIAKVNAATLTPGTKVCFNRGDEWRENLIIPTSGTETNRITFTAYGTGVKPIINGADVITGWGDSYNNINLNIWGTVDPSESPHFANVIIADSLYTEVSTLAEVTSARKYWVKTASTPDSIYVWSKTDPDSRTTEVAARNDGIYSFDKEYITISYLEVRNAGKEGIKIIASANYSQYFVIDSCRGYRNRLGAIWLQRSDYGLVTNCITSYNGFGVTSWLADNVTISHCYDDHSVYNRAGDGGWGAWTDATGYQLYSCTGSVIEYCETYKAPIGIFLDPWDADGDRAGTDQFVMTARYNKILEGDRLAWPGTSMGICANIGVAGAITNIYYNLIKNTAYVDEGNLYIASDDNTVNVYNNTIVVDGSDQDLNCIRVVHPTNVILKNNIYYYNATLLPGYWAAQFLTDESFVSDYNQYYEFNQTGTRFLQRNSISYSDLATWQAVIGQDLHSALGNPLFVNPASDYSLQAGSPCINTGTVLSDIPQTDILGHPIVGLPDKGCYEKQ